MWQEDFSLIKGDRPLHFLSAIADFLGTDFNDVQFLCAIAHIFDVLYRRQIQDLL